MQFEKTQRVILELGDAGAFDETQAKYPCVLRVGDEWWMWYNGRSADGSVQLVGDHLDVLVWRAFGTPARDEVFERAW